MEVRAVLPDLPQQTGGAVRSIAPQELLSESADPLGHGPVEAADQRHAVAGDFSDHGQILPEDGDEDQARRAFHHRRYGNVQRFYGEVCFLGTGSLCQLHFGQTKWFLSEVGSILTTFVHSRVGYMQETGHPLLCPLSSSVVAGGGLHVGLPRELPSD